MICVDFIIGTSFGLMGGLWQTFSGGGNNDGRATEGASLNEGKGVMIEFALGMLKWMS